MKIQIEINVSAAALAAAKHELERQYEAMRRVYPQWQQQGVMSGATAERRLYSQEVAIRAVRELGRLVKNAELAALAADVDPGDYDGPLGD